jgi:hypothetical protein
MRQQKARSDTLSFLAMQLFFLVGCTPNYGARESTRVLAGKYRLVTTNNCSYGPVESDVLILHPGGRLEQHLTLKYGHKFDVEQGHWEFSPPSNVRLERRWDYYFAPKKGPEQGAYSLIVEFTRNDPPVMVVHPDDNCFYEQVPKTNSSQ